MKQCQMCGSLGFPCDCPSINYGRKVEVAEIKEVPIAEQLIQALAENAKLRAEVERLKLTGRKVNPVILERDRLQVELDRHKRALELALYYVEGDATYEIVKEKVKRILEGRQ